MAKRKSDVLADSSSHATSSTGQAKRRQETDIIEAANALSIVDFFRRIYDAHGHEKNWSQVNHNGGVTDVDLVFAGALETDDLNDCFNLIESTSRHDYEPSSFGWHPKRKLREMKEEEMRYLICRTHGPGSKEDKHEFGGFVSFMLTYDSVPAVPVVYIYEIHLTERMRSQGLAKHLMTIVEMIARKFEVEKVMLTCFKANTNAYSFYRHLGYAKDVSSPEDRKTRNKVVQTDYVIMSKDVRCDGATVAKASNGHSGEQTQVNTQRVSKGKGQANGIASLDDCCRLLEARTRNVKSSRDLTYGEGIRNGDQALESMLKDDGVAEAEIHLRTLAACIGNYERGLHVIHVYRSAVLDNFQALRKHLGAMLSFARKNYIRMPNDLKQTCPGEDKGVYGELRREVDSFQTSLQAVLNKHATQKAVDQYEAGREQSISKRELRLGTREKFLDSWEDELRKREKVLAQREEVHDGAR